jgi:hypothetical protein
VNSERKEKHAKVDINNDRVNNTQGCNCNADALQKELVSTQEELARMKDEYGKQGKLIKELREEKGGFKRLLVAQ